VELLHVGSTIPRKRVDVLLEVFARVARAVPSAHLVRVGGPFTLAQQRRLGELGIDGKVSVLGYVDDRTLAAVYRRAALVLLPSDREGFGLPLVEAMACGTPAVASDLAVLREVGGTAAEFCAPGAVAHWCTQVLALLDERRRDPDRWMARRQAGLVHARRFTWAQFASRLARVYRDVAASADPLAESVPREAVNA